MNAEEMSQQWQQSSQQASQTIAQWRAAHPEATLAEIEAAVDEQMNRLRAGMIEEVAQASRWSKQGAGSKPGSVRSVANACRPVASTSAACKRTEVNK
jgi:exonuclease VII large subunit